MRAVHARRIAIVSECLQLPRQIDCVPEQLPIEIFAANGDDQAFDARMRNRDKQGDFLDLEHAQVGEPKVEGKQRRVIGANVFRQRWAGDGVIDPPANRGPVKPILARSTPKPTSRRLNTSMTNSAQ